MPSASKSTPVGQTTMFHEGAFFISITSCIFGCRI